MHGLAPAPRQGVFWWAVAWNHMEWVCCKTTGVFLLPQLFWHLYVHVSESKPSVSLQNFDQLFDVPSHLWPIHNDLLAQQCPLQITSMTIGVMRFGELDAVHFSVCWPLWYHCLAWLGSQNALWSDSNHNGQSWNPELVSENTNGWCSFVAHPKKIWNLLGCITAFLLGLPRPSVLAPPRISGSVLWDLCCWCALALYPKCLPTRQTPVRAYFQTTGSLSTACVCSCPAQSRIKHEGMSESFRFLKPSSRITCLLCNVCANCISLVSFLWPFFIFSKATTSFCCFGAGEHLGHPWQW